MTNFDDRDDQEQQQEPEGWNPRPFRRGSQEEREWQTASREEQQRLREGKFLNADGSVPTRRQLDEELAIRDQTGYSQTHNALAAFGRANGPREIYLRLDDERDHDSGLYRIKNARQVEQQLRDYFPAEKRSQFARMSDYEVISVMRGSWHHPEDDGFYHNSGYHAKIDDTKLVRQGRMLEDNNAQLAAEELSYRVQKRGLNLDEPVRMITPHADRARDHMPPADIHPEFHTHDGRTRPAPGVREVLGQMGDDLAHLAERLPWRRQAREEGLTLDDRREAFAERQWRAVEGAKGGGLVDVSLGAHVEDDVVTLADPRHAARILRSNFVAQEHEDLRLKSTGELLALVRDDLTGMRYADDLRRDGRVCEDMDVQRAAEELTYRISKGGEWLEKSYSALSYEQQRERVYDLGHDL